jgi:alanine racemase
VGGEVILWGEGLPVDEVALSTAHINYDLLTGVHERAKALWS